MTEAAPAPQTVESIPSEAVQQIETRRGDVAQEIERLEIASQRDLDRATELLHSIAQLVAEVKATFDPVVAAANKTHKAATAARARHLDPLKQADATVRTKIGAYVTEQKRIAAEHERALAEEAKREADERALEEAAALEAQGDAEGAARRLAEAESGATSALLPPPQPAVDKVAGLAIREVWKARVVDPVAFARGISEGTIPPSMMEPTANLQAFARSTRGEVRWPGVEFYAENAPVRSGRR